MKPCLVCKTPSDTDICTACSLTGWGFCQFCSKLKPDILLPFANESRHECYECYLDRTQEREVPKTTLEETKDIAFLANQIRIWERRFIDGNSPNLKAMTALKDEFIAKYGLEKTREVIRQATSEVSREMMGEELPYEEIVPIIPIFPQRERRPHKPKQPEKRFKKVARCFYH